MAKPQFKEILELAWHKRAGLRTNASAFRLLNGTASGTPGLVVDNFGNFLVAYAYDTDLRDRFGDFPEVLASVTGAKGLTIKDRAVKDEESRGDSRDLLGQVPETAEVREGPLRFIVHLQHPRNVGLFLDTRPLREFLAQSCTQHEVLNLFSYSCSLGIAAAFRNEGTVVNVDVSARYLDWGKANLRVNNLPAERTKFVRMDSEKYLDWAAKKSLVYDVIILDPPSFSRTDTKTFSFAQDYWRLVEKCAKLVKPSGRFFAMTNYGQITPEQFRAKLDETLKNVGRPAASLSRLDPPEDFDLGKNSPKQGTSKSASGKDSDQVTPEGTLIAFEAVLA